MGMIYLCTLNKSHILYDKNDDIVYGTYIIRYDEGNNNKQCFFGSDMINYGLLSTFDNTPYISRIPCVSTHIYGVFYYDKLIYPKHYGEIPVKDILNMYLLDKILDSI